MKNNFLLIVVSMSLTTCSRNHTANSNPADNSTRTADSIEITKLIRTVYQWHESVDTTYRDFPFAFKDTLLTGINWVQCENRLNELGKTKFFAKEFLDSYRRVSTHIDSIIKFGGEKYDTHLIPPFVPDANEWCNCQMTDTGKYWQRLVIHDLQYHGKSATFHWKWGPEFSYAVGAMKEDSIWKISYLEGFDQKLHTNR